MSQEPRILGSCSLIAAICFVACSGQLPTAELDAFYANPPPCDAPAEVFQPRCSQCHQSGPQLQGELDLVSAGVADRLVGVPSSLCRSQTLVVAGYPDASYLLFKVDETPPPCGSQMPLGQAPLSKRELACLGSWIGGLHAPDAGPGN